MDAPRRRSVLGIPRHMACTLHCRVLAAGLGVASRIRRVYHDHRAINQEVAPVADLRFCCVIRVGGDMSGVGGAAKGSFDSSAALRVHSAAVACRGLRRSGLFARRARALVPIIQIAP